MPKEEEEKKGDSTPSQHRRKKKQKKKGRSLPPAMPCRSEWRKGKRRGGRGERGEEDGAVRPFGHGEKKKEKRYSSEFYKGEGGKGRPPEKNAKKTAGLCPYMMFIMGLGGEKGGKKRGERGCPGLRERGKKKKERNVNFYPAVDKKKGGRRGKRGRRFLGSVVKKKRGGPPNGKRQKGFPA